MRQRVVAVYTAAGDTGKVTSLDVEYIRERRLGPSGVFADAVTMS